MDEEKLIERARQGSLEAFTEILREHQGRVRAYLNRYVRAREVVDDLAQDVFLTAYRSLGSYRGDAPLAVWLLGIARHRALMLLREEGRRKAREGQKLEQSLAEWKCRRVEEAPLEERAVELRALEDCLASLPADSAKLVSAHYFEERPLVELAKTAGRKESALRMTLLRVRQSLRMCVEGKLVRA
jgi:RNA polymerase sigma-70 factor (ECF subfamily)